MRRTSGLAGAARRAAMRFVETLEERRLLAAVLVTDINLTGAGSSPRDLIEYREHVYFIANDVEHGNALWRTPVANPDAGAEIAVHWEPNATNTLSIPLVVLDDRMIIEGPYGLLSSDGTPAGTTMLKDGLSVDERVTPVVIDGVLYFNGSGDGKGRELWKTDGTAAGTVLVKDVRPGSAESRPAELTAVGDTLFFVADAA